MVAEKQRKPLGGYFILLHLVHCESTVLTQVSGVCLRVVQGMFAPVKGNYSEEFKSLVMDMLQRDPDSRPSAADLCQIKLPPVSVSLTQATHPRLTAQLYFQRCHGKVKSKVKLGYIIVRSKVQLKAWLNLAHLITITTQAPKTRFCTPVSWSSETGEAM